PAARRLRPRAHDLAGASRRGSERPLRSRRRLQLLRLPLERAGCRARRPPPRARDRRPPPGAGAYRRAGDRGSARDLSLPLRRARAGGGARARPRRRRRSTGLPARLARPVKLVLVFVLVLVLAPTAAADCPPRPGPGSVDPFRPPAPEATE